MAAKLTVFALIATLFVLGGCIISSDEDHQPASETWSPELYVTPDSVLVWFPRDWPEQSTWIWNRSIPHTWDYVLEASLVIPYPNGGRDEGISIHIAFAHESDSTGVQSGTFEELVQASYGFLWTENPLTGEQYLSPIPVNDVRVRDDGIEVRVAPRLGTIIHGNPALDSSFWGATFNHRGLFGNATVRRPAHYVHDELQQRARLLRGSLTPDDCVIMDLVSRDYARRWSGPLVIETPTQTHQFSNELNNMAVLNPRRETRRAFTERRRTAVDIGSLSQLGYIVVDKDTSVPGLQVRFSAIGYNRQGNEALIYADFSCGGLCGEGEVILLQKVGGYWLISNRITLWLS